MYCVVVRVKSKLFGRASKSGSSTVRERKERAVKKGRKKEGRKESRKRETKKKKRERKAREEEEEEEETLLFQLFIESLEEESRATRHTRPSR